MSVITTNKNALKLLRIDGTILNTNSISIDNSNNNTIIASKHNKYSKSQTTSNNIDITINTKSSNMSTDHTQISDYIRQISEMESTPELSEDSQDEDEDLFMDSNDNKSKQKPDITDGIELMLQRLQTEAKMIEQKRYQKYAENINNNNNAIIPTPTPNDIVQLT
eukprot:235008_1